MKYFHTTTYNIKNNNEFKVCVLSDIHFSKQFKNSKLNYIKKYLLNLKPNYILIAGDLLDSLDEIKNSKENKRLYNWLEEIASISKVFIVLGNHDMVKKHHDKFKYDNRTSFFKKICKIDNLYILDNDIYEDKNIYICGITESAKFYKTCDIEVLKVDLNQNSELLNYNNKNKVKILLIHSPVGFNDEEIINITHNFDYVVTGHMHNGCVPPIINDIWRSTRGIITPKKRLFVKNQRNTLRNNKDKLLVNGPVTTFSKSAGIIHYFNIIYPIYNSVFVFNKNNKFNIKRKYHLK